MAKSPAKGLCRVGPYNSFLFRTVSAVGLSKPLSCNCLLSWPPRIRPPTRKRSTEEKAPVILLFYSIPERTASQELGSREISKNCSKLPPPKGWKESITFCYGCTVLMSLETSGQAQPGEGEGQLVNQLCCTQHYPCPGSGIVPYMDSGSGLPSS